MNASSLKARRMTYAAQHRYERMANANARAVDMIVVRAWDDMQTLIAKSDFPNAKFQQRLRSILYDDIMAKLIVAIRKQLEDAAVLGWQTGVDMHTSCIPREVWVKWAKWKSGIREQFDPHNPKITEAALTEMMMFRWAAKAISLVVDFAELIAGKELDQANWLKRLEKIVFPPPSKAEAEAVLRSDRWPDRKTWPQRLQREGLSFDSIVNQVSTSMSQGKNVKEITKDIEPLVNNVRVRARRIARTESIRVAQAMQRETDKHVDDLVYGRQILSVGDERVRPEHKERHGRVYYKAGWGPPGAPDISECPETPDAPNCVLPGAIVSGQFVAGLKADYAGQAVEVRTLRGRVIRVTPNHRVLTVRGFTAANQITNGDYLVCDRRVVELTPVMPDNVNQTPAAIENVFRTLTNRAASAGAIAAADATAFDFHGDERVCKGDVYVVATDRHLLDRLDTQRPKVVAQNEFVRANMLAAHESRERAGLLATVAIDCVAPAGPCLDELPLDLGGAFLERLPLEQFSIGPTANLHAGLLEVSQENAPDDAGLVGYLLERHSADVEFDEVVEIRNLEFSGHVYDLQSTVGWYSCNGIITHNCRCTTYVLYKGIDQIGLEHLRFSPDFMPANVRQQQEVP